MANAAALFVIVTKQLSGAWIDVMHLRARYACKPFVLVGVIIRIIDREALHLSAGVWAAIEEGHYVAARSETRRTSNKQIKRRNESGTIPADLAISICGCFVFAAALR